MELDYADIGKRIARRRNAAGLTQAELSERASISSTYMSSIERAVSIPSTEVIMRLAAALDTTPDEFLVGTVRRGERDEWKNTAELLRGMTSRQLTLVRSFLIWLSQQDLK